jgi:hypothetical protein
MDKYWLIAQELMLAILLNWHRDLDSRRIVIKVKDKDIKDQVPIIRIKDLKLVNNQN